MHTFALFFVLTGGLAATPDATALTARFDTPEELDAWSFSNGAEFPGATGSMAYDDRDGHGKAGCLALRYSFAGGGNYVQATWALPRESTSRTMSLWLKKPAGHRVTFRLLDSGGQTFQKGVEYVYPGWQHVEVDLNKWAAHFGGANDGKIQWPARALGIIVDNTAEPREGTMLIDDVELIDRQAAPNVQIKPDVHEVDGAPRFSAELAHPGDAPAQGRLICELRRLNGRLGTQTTELELPAGGKGVRQEFACAPGDANLVEASFQWIGANAAAKPVTIGWSRAVDDTRPATLNANSPLGCGLYLYRWRGNPKATASMNRAADLARRAGIKWTREEFQWGATEPQPGKFDFAFYDQMVEVAHAHGIHVYGLLCYWAPWAKANTPEGIEAYCRWAREVVRRYKGKIKHWEVWNEPNIFFWTGPKELYATLLDQAYTAIKAEDPDAQVLGCSTSGIDTSFIRMVMEKKARFDVLTIHPYRGTLQDMDYVDDLRKARELAGGREVWLTEIGFSSQRETGWSERQQASLAARVYLLSLASGAVHNVSWYDFRNDGDDAFYNENNFGLVRSDFRLKPAYRAVATTCRQLGGLRVKARIEVGDGAYAYRFGNEQRDVIAACAPETSRLLSFETDADVKLVDGVEQPVWPAKDGKRFTIALDAGFPVYVSGKAGFAFKAADAPVVLRVEPGSVHPGELAHVTIRPSQEVKRWDLPFGWTIPVDVGSGVHVYALRVPANAAPGPVDAQVEIGEGVPLRVPFTVCVVPDVVRL